MYRIFAVGLLLALISVFAAPASARMIDLGAEPTAKPSCPTSPCEVVSRTTAYQVRVTPGPDMFMAPADGRIVAWSITLGNPTSEQLRFFRKNLGGEAQAGVAVLKQGIKYYGRVTAASPLQELTPYFGETVQFPLERTLPVSKGSVVALSVPTWAPALELGLQRETVWRASRKPDSCDDTQTQSVQADLGDLIRYRCYYRTARLTYSVTMITNPKPKKVDDTQQEQTTTRTNRGSRR